MPIPQTILRRYQEDIEKISALDSEAFSALVSGLRNTRLTVIPSTLALDLAPSIEAVSQSDLEEIVITLLSLCSLRDQFDSSTREVADGVYQALQGASDEERVLIRDRLVELLSVDSLNVIAKSGSLQTNQQRWMRSAQILTDIRPVFGPDPKKPPKAAVVVHVLKLSYYEDGEAKDFYIGIDTTDLGNLYDQLERANDKAESLRSMLAAAEVTHVEDKDETGEGKNGTS